jgi:two-component system CheB/CheR fusion protein
MIHLEDRRGGLPKEVDLVKEVDHILLCKYNPAAVVVNSSMDILHFRGDTSPYLEHLPGKASLNLVKMAREPLRMELRTLLHKAKKENKPQNKEHVHLLCGDAPRKIRLSVIPFSASEDELYYLIQFESQPEQEAAEVLSGGGEEAEFQKEIDHLKQELSACFDYTQTLIEEKESALEELTAANEEILSSNEELQSINKEMETAKEELESTNEELVIVNTELQSRNEELSRAHDDLQNLILSAEIPFVIVNRDLCISRISPQAEAALNIRRCDLERPLNDIRLNFELPQMEKLISQVINMARSEEREILNKQGQWNLLRIRPYLTAENRIEGAVLSLIDIDRLKRSMEELEQSYKFALRIVDTIKDPLLVLNGDLRVKTANPSFYETFQVAPDKTEGQLVYQLGSGQWNIPELRTLLEQLLAKSAKMDNFLVTFDFPALGERSMLLSARKIVTLYPEQELILLSIEDVTLRLKLEEDLRQAKRKAEASSQAKSEFLANMSHEIRTPMTVVQGAVEQLQRTDLAPEQKLLLDMAGNSAQVLMELLGDILDFSMIEAKKIKLERRAFCPRKWAENIIDVLLAEARRKGLTLSLEVAPEVPATIFADSNRLRQVVVNLVGNALKFTERGELKLSIELTTDDLKRQMLRFSVSDTGIGIPEDKIHLIFSTFSQADASMTRKYGGTGLGLSICKQLVECMDGEIRVQSKAGKGSTFSFTIPLLRSDKQLEQKVPEETRLNGPLVRHASEELPRILIVEDDESIRSLLESLLTSQGWHASSTENGEQALRCLESATFDLVLTDLQMPGMDGRELAKIIREKEKRTEYHLPIIALTGHAQKIDQQNCLEAGMDDYISKPFSTVQLFAVMERLLKKSI